MSHFNPLPRSPVADPYGDNASRMEGAKANYTMALLTSESCMNKCSVTDASARMSEVEGDCLRQCFVKYFDCQLLVNNEMTNYVRGIDL
mmetsp:Transcript_19781/g.26739  ORF Transcript_19781/g.26739 Transcript_19781/m.26739 type:complete len:89 (+) Transcript_19781:38-304(+)|eukprot:CAMPEP_0170451438 /NCGR_PEP_ID=MMETSP0123-20130129/679_1 /TAXON_ID=182087 /ORGANISM="Favella ehrenbergii, Strain Fehren 1" /LENGTH=88 /DNA_ID=CAMNT_0010713129 /DNA_START=23 /DNA_END=289 /DNA_ORIENTATION=+